MRRTDGGPYCSNRSAFTVSHLACPIGSTRTRPTLIRLNCAKTNDTQGPPTDCDSPSSVASGRNRENSAPLRVPHLDQAQCPNESAQISELVRGARFSWLLRRPFVWATRREESRLFSRFPVRWPARNTTPARDTVVLDCRCSGQRPWRVRRTLFRFGRFYAMHLYLRVR